MALPIRNTLHPGGSLSMRARKARRKFLRFFPGGFYDQKYIDWERGYKWAVHQAWDHTLNQEEYRRLLRGHEFQEVADLAVALEARTYLLFSFEKMALRDAVRTFPGARTLITGLYQFLYGSGAAEAKSSAGWKSSIPCRANSRAYSPGRLSLSSDLWLCRSSIFISSRR